MSTTKVAISMEETVLQKVDRLVRRHVFPNRSRAIQNAVEEKLARLDHRRLAEESAKLNPAFEQAMAEEGINKEIDEWPAY